MNMRSSEFGCIAASIVILLAGCVTGSGGEESASEDYRNEMRNLVEDLSSWYKSISSSFIIVPQYGQELITENGEPDGSVDNSYTGAVDGFGREDLFFGYQSDDTATPADETFWMM